MTAGYLSRVPFEPLPYEAMAARNALMRGTTQAMYDTSVASFRALKGVTVSAIRYLSDGLIVTGMEVLPDDLAPGEKIPLLIYNRGGSGDYGMLSAGQANALMAPFVRQLRLGALASNYRGNGDSEGREEWGGGDVNDVLNLIALGQQQEWWDGKNIFMLGWSRGGMMTYLAIKHGAPLTAAAVGAGVTDLLADGPEDMERVYHRYLPGYPANREALFRERSAVYWPEKLDVPLLMLHGDADDRVYVAEARDLAGKLQALGKEVRYIEYPGGDHALRREWKDWTARVAEWFAAHRVA